MTPAADLGRLEVVRIFDYGLGGVVPPEVPGRSQPAAVQQSVLAGRSPALGD